MTYLVDTNILSETAPGRPGAAELVLWLNENSAAIYLSVVTITEVESGIAKAECQGATKKAKSFRVWLDGIEREYAGRVHDIDIEVARLAGRLRDRALGRGHDPGPNDVFIAATAVHHGLTVLTRNLRHFRPLGVLAIDPIADIPGTAQTDT